MFKVNLKQVGTAEYECARGRDMRNAGSAVRQKKRKINGQSKKKKLGLDYGVSFQILEFCTFSRQVPRTRRG